MCAHKPNNAPPITQTHHCTTSCCAADLFLALQLVTAKSSEVNVNVVPSDPNSNADAVEHAVPEQFISSFKDGKLITVAASHSGG